MRETVKLPFRLDRVRFYVLAAFILVTFLMGGGARDDIQSLVILRPIAALVCGFGLATLTWDNLRQYRTWAVLFGLVLLLPLLQLLPLPPAIWQALPGRDIIVDIDAVSGNEGTWRPITMVPTRTWNAFFSLLVPLAVLLCGIQMSATERGRLLPLILGIGLCSALLGLLQAIGPGSTLLYLYRITNVGAAVGLFANRNHQAFLLATLLPMLVAWAAHAGKTPQQLRVRTVAAAGAGALLLPMILVTGSRGGLLLSLLGGAAAVLLYRSSDVKPRQRGRSGIDWRLPVAGLCLALLAIATVLASRAEAIQRLMSLDVLEDLRFEVLPLLLDLSWRYLPLGTGLGSFVEVFRLHEPDALLEPQYLNHAHNDLVELVLTAGIPGLLLLGLWLVALGRSTWATWRTRWPEEPARQSILLRGRAATVGVAILLLAGLLDYPLRTPSIAALFMLMLLWINDCRRKQPA